MRTKNMFLFSFTLTFAILCLKLVFIISQKALKICTFDAFLVKENLILSWRKCFALSLKKCFVNVRQLVRIIHALKSYLNDRQLSTMFKKQTLSTFGMCRELMQLHKSQNLTLFCAFSLFSSLHQLIFGGKGNVCVQLTATNCCLHLSRKHYRRNTSPELFIAYSRHRNDTRCKRKLRNVARECEITWFSTIVSYTKMVLDKRTPQLCVLNRALNLAFH